MDRNEAASVIRKYLTCTDITHSCNGKCKACRYHTNDDEKELALRLAIKALEGKDIDVPTKEAIPYQWVVDYLAWLKDIGGYGLSDARAIQSMIIKWKMEHTDGCGPDYCEIGGDHK